MKKEENVRQKKNLHCRPAFDERDVDLPELFDFLEDFFPRPDILN
jgi:hypothetical protein